MRLMILAAAAALALESAASACSCAASDDPAELRRWGADAGKKAVALVEVEVVNPYNPASRQGEVMRVVRTIAGTARAQFQVPRPNFPSGASCDVEYRAGQRDEVLLYPAAGSNGTGMPAHRISGLCTPLDQPAFRDAVIHAIRRAGGGERGLLARRAQPAGCSLNSRAPGPSSSK